MPVIGGEMIALASLKRCLEYFSLGENFILAKEKLFLFVNSIRGICRARKSFSCGKF